ncbi:MAG: MazG nucleotide pyrophosphohydrolase domain-containing protein [Planctomycetota bacterium]
MSDDQTTRTEDPLTFRDFQRHIRDRYFETDHARGTAGTFMWLVEEVGELATALHKSAGEGGDTSGDDDPAGEFADVIAWLCTLANINGVDLEQALRDKYFEGGGPKGHK